MSQDTKEHGQNGSQSELADLSLLLDVPLQVTVELGRARMTIDNFLRLAQGSVVELNRMAGEPLDIYVNNKLVARGEAVVVKEKFGVRIIDVVSPEKRLENLP
jgi:flagellar motor switch protein FliN/FliY